MRYLLEIIIAVLAVYGGYTALHELTALLKKWTIRESTEQNQRKGRGGHFESGRINKRKK